MAFTVRRLAVVVVAVALSVGCGKSANPGNPGGGGGGGGGGGSAASLHAPVLTQPDDVAMTAGTSQAVTFVATDADGDALTFSIADLPSYATLNGATLTLAPDASVAETRAILVKVSDGALTDSKSFVLTINAPPNLPPSLSGLGQQDAQGNAIAVGSTITQSPKLVATVSDPENGQVKLEAEVIPATASFSGIATHAGALASGGTVSLQLPTLAPGAWKWQLRAVDAVGGGSDWLAFNSGQTAFTLVPGTFSGTLTIGTGATVTASPVVDLAISATPPQGATLVSMRFSNDGTNYSAIEPYSATRSSWALSPGNGQKTVTVEVKASNGDIGTFTANVVLDSTAPTIAAFTIDDGAMVTNSDSATLTYTATDTGTGVTTVEASNDGTTFSAIGASPASGWTLAPGDGFKTVTLRVTDGAGNSQMMTAFIRLDQTPPTLASAIITPAVTNNAAVNLTVLATDGAGSGLDQLCVTGPVSSPGCQDFPATSVLPVTLTGNDGNKTLTITVTDFAGNSSTNNVTASTRLDTTPPNAPPMPLITGGHRSITATWGAATDPSGSGIAGYEVAINGAADAGTWTFVPASAQFSHTFGGIPNSPDLAPVATRFVEVRARDNAGNVGPASPVNGGFARWPFRYGFRDAVPNIRGIAFADDNTLVAVGDSSLVLTVNGPFTAANHAIRRDPLLDVDLTAITALNNGAALIAVGGVPAGDNSPAILLSTDKGLSWTRIAAPSALNGKGLYSVAATTVNATSFGFTAVGSFGALVNGVFNAATKQVTLSTPTTPPTSSAYFYGVTGCQAFACNQTVLAVGTGGTIVRSLDGGNTWAAVTSNLTSTLRAVGHEGGTVGVFYAVGDYNGTVNAVRSTDNGATWTADVTGTGTTTLSAVTGLGNGSVIFANYPPPLYAGWSNGYSTSSSAYRVTTSSAVAVYSGSGRGVTAPIGNMYAAASRISTTSQKMFAWAGEWGQISVSLDNGNTWTDQWITGSNWLHHFVVNPSGTRVMGVGYGANPNSPYWGAATSVGWMGDAIGKNWTKQTLPEPTSYPGVQAFSWQGDNGGFALGRDGMTWSMSTASPNWTPQDAPGDNYHSVDCVQAGECLASGNAGYIGRYTGTLPGTPISETSGSAACGTCAAGAAGYCCTAPYWYGVTYYQDAADPNLFHGVVVGSAASGGGSGASARVISVTFNSTYPNGNPVLDAIQTLPLSTNLNRVDGRPSGIVVAVGNSGIIMRSTSHGAAGSWSQITPPIFGTFNDVAAGPNADWFIVGNGGILLKSKDDGVTWTKLATYTTKNLLNVATHPVTNLMWISADGPGALFSQTGGE